MKKSIKLITMGIIVLLISLTFSIVTFAVEYGLIYFTDRLGHPMDSYWKLESTTGVLTIYGEGVTPDYDSGGCAPYAGAVNGFNTGPLVKTVIVEEGITRIGDYAMTAGSGSWTTPNVETVYLASSVSEIGEWAFNRNSIQEVIIYSEAISFEERAVSPSATIYGYAGSSVEEYALENGNPFVALCREHNVELVDYVKPGCESKGFSGNKVCTVCGVTLEKGHPLEAVGHNFENNNRVEPTCTETGYSGDVCCTECGLIQEQGEILPANGHLFGGWQVTTMPTCHSLGEKIRFCENCDEYEIADIGMVNHKWNEFYSVDNAATCTEMGSESIHCSVCEAVDETTVREIPAAGHTEEVIPELPATCTESGLTEGKRCPVCDETLVAQIVVPALGHDYQNDVCIRCGDALKNGWKQEAGIWYYYTSGVAATDWKQVGGKWYLFNSVGEMLTGWQKSGNTWYYMNSSGAMVTGWQQIGGTWYYFAGSGAMVTGWQQISGTWYFFKSSGAMAANEWCGGYWLNANGSWTYKPVGSWKKDGNGWWFGDTSGWYAKNATIKIDNVWYKFNAAGYWVK